MDAHMAADFRTLMAGVAAFAAMFHFGVLAALAGAAVAGFNAKLAQFFSQRAIQAHDLRRGRADSGAFQVQLDTFGEVMNIVFLQAA